MSRYLLISLVILSGCVSSRKYKAMSKLYHDLDAQVVEVVSYCTEIHMENKAITKELHACDEKIKKGKK